MADEIKLKDKFGYLRAAEEELQEANKGWELPGWTDRTHYHLERAHIYALMAQSAKPANGSAWGDG